MRSQLTWVGSMAKVVRCSEFKHQYCQKEEEEEEEEQEEEKKKKPAPFTRGLILIRETSVKGSCYAMCFL
jgi:hypothetical protein